MQKLYGSGSQISHIDWNCSKYSILKQTSGITLNDLHKKVGLGTVKIENKGFGV